MILNLTPKHMRQTVKERSSGFVISQQDRRKQRQSWRSTTPINIASPYPTAAFASALPFQERLHHKNTQTQKFLIQTTWICCSW